MKKSFAFAAALALSFSALSMNALCVNAEDPQVFVTISDNNSKLVLTQEPVSVTDIDSDGKLTINDALYIAHDNNFEGGAAAGYKSSVGQWGLGLDKLWGVENGGSYGYYVNDGFAMGLADEVKDGDIIEAFIYPDPKDYNYFYSFFDKKNGEDAEPDTEVELTLSYYTFGADGALVTNKLSGAKLTVNGNDAGVVTDADGKASVKLTEAGKNIISAETDSVKIAPPSYVVNVKGEAVTTTTTTTSTTSTTTTSTTTTAAAKTTVKATTTAAKGNSPKTGDNGTGLVIFALGAAAAVAFTLRRKNEE